MRIDNDGAEEVLSGTTVLVFNLPRYALGLPFAPEARDDDGWLDLVVFREPGPFQALYYLWKVLLGSHLDDPGVFHRRVKKVVVTADHPIPVQLDGDPGGYVLPQNSAFVDTRCPRRRGEWGWSGAETRRRTCRPIAHSLDRADPAGRADSVCRGRSSASARSCSARRRPALDDKIRPLWPIPSVIHFRFGADIPGVRGVHAKGGKDGSSQPSHDRSGPDRQESPAGLDRRPVCDGAG